MKKYNRVLAGVIAGIFLIAVPVSASDTDKKADERSHQTQQRTPRQQLILEKEYELFQLTKDEIEITADLLEGKYCAVSASVPNLPQDVAEVLFHIYEREDPEKSQKYYPEKEKEDIWKLLLDTEKVSVQTIYEVRIFGIKEDNTRMALGMAAFQTDGKEVRMKNPSSNQAEIKEPNQIETKQEAQIQEPDQKGNIFLEDPRNNPYGYYSIMGNSSVTAEEMKGLFQDKNQKYPSKALEKGGASTLEEFCEIIIQESALEEVRAEVVFAQAMLETGWLTFGGDAEIEQFNFSGLGATGGGVKGIYFPDVRTGIRAQVQHLKAYASSMELNQTCVDERFSYVSRESAPYVEWLGIQENPYKTGWAASAGYGDKLLILIDELNKQ